MRRKYIKRIPRIRRDKRGRKYIIFGNKKIYLKTNLSDSALLKVYVNNFTSKAKRRPRKKLAKKTYTKSLLDTTPQITATAGQDDVSRFATLLSILGRDTNKEPKVEPKKEPKGELEFEDLLTSIKTKKRVPEGSFSSSSKTPTLLFTEPSTGITPKKTRVPEGSFSSTPFKTPKKTHSAPLSTEYKTRTTEENKRLEILQERIQRGEILNQGEMEELVNLSIMFPPSDTLSELPTEDLYTPEVAPKKTRSAPPSISLFEKQPTTQMIPKVELQNIYKKGKNVPKTLVGESVLVPTSEVTTEGTNLSISNVPPVVPEGESTSDPAAGVGLTEAELRDILYGLNEADDLFSGEGKSDKAGLYDGQINMIMRPYKKYGWTRAICADEIPTLLPYVKKGKPLAFIINTDTSDGKGKHWQACYIDPKYDQSVEFFDSYAEPPSKRFMTDIKKIIDKMDPDNYLKFKENKVIQQSVNSNNCGFFCMKFLIDRMEGKPFKECTGFSQVAKGEKEIKKFKKKYGFGYI